MAAVGGVASRLSGVLLSLFSALVRPGGVLCPVLGSSVKTGTHWRVQQKAMKMMKALEHLSYEEGLRELGLLILKKRGLRMLSMYRNT